MLQHLLREETVLTHLEAPNPEAALAEMMAYLPSVILHPKKKIKVLERLLQRERFGTTAIGDELAFPHCVTDQVEHPVASLGISRHGIAFPSLDGRPVHVILMLLFPENYLDRPERLQVLKESEKIFRDRFLRECLKTSETSKQAFAIFQREVTHLIQEIYPHELKALA